MLAANSIVGGSSSDLMTIQSSQESKNFDYESSVDLVELDCSWLARAECLATSGRGIEFKCGVLMAGSKGWKVGVGACRLPPA